MLKRIFGGSPVGIALSVAGIVLAMSPEARRATRRLLVKGTAAVMGAVESVRHTATDVAEGTMETASRVGERTMETASRIGERTMETAGRIGDSIGDTMQEAGHEMGEMTAGMMNMGTDIIEGQQEQPLTH